MASPPPPSLHSFYEEDPDEDFDDDDDQNDVVDDDIDVDDDSTSSPDPPPPSTVTIAVAGLLTTPEPKQTPDSSALTVNAERKPLPLPLEESRKLFQRLWTDEDEIELLQGFLDYTISKGSPHTHNSHHDTTAFYDLIKSKLQLDFNKNQLVEKLRRLKKKYRNVLSKIISGKEYVFKTSHDQVTFEISKKIWGNVGGVGRELDEDEGNGNLSLGHNLNVAFTMDDVNNNISNVDGNGDCSGGKVGKSRKRSRVNVKVEEKQIDQTPILVQPQSVVVPPQGLVSTPLMGSVPNLIEETVRSCLSPLFKELLNNAMTGSRAGGMINSTTNSMMGPLGIGGLSMNFAGGDMDDKWRKQQILELEVYSKRLELIQDQIKSQLEELKSMGN
ncbi:DNA-binding storekeeper protein-related transcriptional regulator [Heracleum sosnowskyi]|uniref:DNA-binding storekeeper protein-related transcriptional regulator n=1 Tax=Heracleum sosnowskyi TaxID=360622 RepID=A0AAD8N9V0_9APIA|nr:DNA-binding storekeeper protein-related transcriptional regulator [Heracleum sosnowskyi]